MDAGHPDPDWPKSGKIEIQDPRERAEMFRLPDDPYGLTAEFQADVGAMIVWPSWLLHWVNPFYGEGERISIAFNARIEQSKPALPRWPCDLTTAHPDSGIRIITLC